MTEQEIQEINEKMRRLAVSIDDMLLAIRTGDAQVKYGVSSGRLAAYLMQSAGVLHQLSADYFYKVIENE